MPRQDSPANSPFNDFLFIYVGEEGSGMHLTVLSALARQGLDPWGEAERLSRLGQDAAVKALMAILAALPEETWKTADIRATALRLAHALPGRGRPASSLAPQAAAAAGAPPARTAADPRAEWQKWLIWAGVVAAAFAVLASMTLTGDSAVDSGALGAGPVTVAAAPPAVRAPGG